MPNALYRFYRITFGVLEVLQISQVSLGCGEFRKCESKFYFAVEELLQQLLRFGGEFLKMFGVKGGLHISSTAIE